MSQWDGCENISKTPQGGARPGAPPQLYANGPSLVVTDSPGGQWPSTATHCLETPVGVGVQLPW